jgi:hypothetical protein
MSPIFGMHFFKMCRGYSRKCGIIKVPSHCDVIIGGFNNIAFLHGLTSRPGFAIDSHLLIQKSPITK